MWFSRQKTSINLRTKSAGQPSVPLSTLIVSILALGGVFGMYWYFRAVPTTQTEREQSKNQQLVEKVGAHVLVPTSESPTIATVSDPTPLQGQPFFDHAERGDKVLVYPNAKRAVLYRPSIDKVVEIMPFVPPQSN